jgi:hypothetical protein
MTNAQALANYEAIASYVQRQIASVHGYLTKAEADSYQAAKDECVRRGISSAVVNGFSEQIGA